MLTMLRADSAVDPNCSIMLRTYLSDLQNDLISNVRKFTLMLTMLWADSAVDKLGDIFLFFFSYKIGFDT